MMIAARKRGTVVPEEGDRRRQGVRPAILLRGGDNAEGYAEHAGEEVTRQRQHQGRRKALRDDMRDRLVEVEAVAEIAARHDAGDPMKILDRDRIEQSVRLAIDVGLRFRVLEEAPPWFISWARM